MAIFKIQKFGCKGEIPTTEDIEYLIHYASIHDCIVELEVTLEIPHFNELGNCYTSRIIEIADGTSVPAVVEQITHFKSICDNIESKPIPDSLEC